MPAHLTKSAGVNTSMRLKGNKRMPQPMHRKIIGDGITQALLGKPLSERTL